MAIGAMPPEIISARMYSGPGSGPMTAAASAWNGLAAELNSAATGYQTAITRLINEEWMGPASGSMAVAAKPYAAWLSTTAAQAEHAAIQARAAAAAYEQAYAMTVPPPMIAANRAQLLSLLRTNVMGMNAPAIAATEAQYQDMWAQDIFAMHAYADQSAAATKLQSFAAPPHTTNLAGQANQAASVSHATGNAAATRTLTSLPNALNGLGSPGAADTAPGGAPVDTAPTPPSGASSIFNNPGLEASNATYANGMSTANLGARSICAVWRGLTGALGAAKFMSDGAAKAAGGAAAAAEGAAGGAANAANGLGGLGGLGAVTGGLGQANSIGGLGLSVPPSWAPAAPAAEAALGPVSGGTWEPIGSTGMMGAVPESAPPGAPGMPGASAAPGMASMAGAGRGGGMGVPPRYGVKPIVMPRIPGVG